MLGASALKDVQVTFVNRNGRDELGAGFNVLRVGRHTYVRAEGGGRFKDPVSASERAQHGIFGRLGVVFDRGAGAVKVPATLSDRVTGN